jgi:hypothetical protein
MNADDPYVQDKGDAVWVEMAKKYSAYFDTIKNKLPKGFMKIFDKNDWFHDFELNNINLLNTGKYSSVVEFQISHNDVVYKITFTGVKGFSVNIPTTQNWLCGMLTWGYTEFELNDDNSWIVRILCDFDCEIEILFKRITVAKVK